MENIKDKFESAVKEVELLKDRPSNETLLQLYSLYKQSTEGDNVKEPPENPFDFVAKAKHEAWASLKGKTPEEAMVAYVELFEKLRN
jgi:diazepam-binding inhibitor (GABA receptor modulator, acyl-CoA-binding protein)